MFNQLLKNAGPQDFELDEKNREVVGKLKSKLTFRPVLAPPNATRQFVVDPAASKSQLGCVLLQGHKDKQAKPVGCWSR